MNPIPPSSTTGEDRVSRIRNEVINKITGDNELINCDVDQNVREIRAIIVTNEEALQRCSSSLRRKVNSPRAGLPASPFGPHVETYFRRSYEDIIVKSLDKTVLPATASQSTSPGLNFGEAGKRPRVPRRGAPFRFKVQSVDDAPGAGRGAPSRGSSHGGFRFGVQSDDDAPGAGRGSPSSGSSNGGFRFGVQSDDDAPGAGGAPSSGSSNGGLFAHDVITTGQKEKKSEGRKRVEYSVKFELTQDYSEKTFNMSLLSKLPGNLDGVLSHNPKPTGRIDYSMLLDRTFLLHEEIQGPYLGALKDHLMNVQVLLGGIETWIIEGSQNADFVEETFGVDLNEIFEDDVAEDVTKTVKECESTLSISADISLSSDTDRLQLIKLLELIDIKPKHDV